MATSTINLNPYLFFGGDCRDALQFYKSIFGGDLVLTRFSETPSDAHADPKANSNEMKDKIMHAHLKGPVTIMASDNPDGQKIENNHSVSLSVDGSDEKILRSYFEKLSDGGRITAPLQKQFWGDTFGMVTDKFGVNWMISITSSEKQQQ